ncbi:Protein of unknown function [Pseudoduganella namucuonensis]|uniref:DUF3108 domain-containing protein n=1 Tax=Pseudoduganella namucuonensis TaxID=1035707 RepID=A0A1I7IFI7_9BURK|nr:Protein of unknown function [Pseudoduganella namucuonensis]
MTLVSLLSRRRRVFALCAATVALHFVTIDWLGTRLGAQQSTTVKPTVMTAQLRLALPPRTASTEPVPEVRPLDPAAPKPRQPAPRPAPRRAAAPTAMPGALSNADPAAPAAAPSETDAFSDALAGLAQGLPPPSPPPAQPDAVPEPPAVQSTPDAVAGPAERQASPAPAPLNTRRYKVNLPPSARFDMELKRTDANGTQWSGEGVMSWRTDGSKYRVGMEAGISMLVTRVNLLELVSEGEIDDAGIAPARFTEKRRGRSQTATHFQRGDGRITFSASERSFPLLAGAQDKASVPFQLGGIGRADVNQFGSDIDILVGEDKNANIYRFQLVGEEEIDTKMGRLVTWHLARPPRPGSYSARLDVWLAPGLNWFPVQIRNTEANGALTTQTVTKITMDDTSGK